VRSTAGVFGPCRFSDDPRSNYNIHAASDMPARFDTRALFEALDAQRVARGLTWREVAAETGVSAATLAGTKRGGRLEVNGALAMVRWLGRTMESFTDSRGGRPDHVDDR
jgi:hypothetical protein